MIISCIIILLLTQLSIVFILYHTVKYLRNDTERLKYLIKNKYPTRYIVRIITKDAIVAIMSFVSVCFFNYHLFTILQNIGITR